MSDLEVPESLTTASLSDGESLARKTRGKVLQGALSSARASASLSQTFSATWCELLR